MVAFLDITKLRMIQTGHFLDDIIKRKIIIANIKQTIHHHNMNIKNLTTIERENEKFLPKDKPNITAAGIFLYLKNGKSIKFILKKDKEYVLNKKSNKYHIRKSYHKSDNSYSDFGGKREQKEHSLQTAIRELYEESIGTIRININELLQKEIKYLDMESFQHKIYRIYFVNIEIKDYISKFNQVYIHFISIVDKYMNEPELVEDNVYIYDNTYELTYVDLSELNKMNKMYCKDITHNEIKLSYRISNALKLITNKKLERY